MASHLCCVSRGWSRIVVTGSLSMVYHDSKVPWKKSWKFSLIREFFQAPLPGICETFSTWSLCICICCDFQLCPPLPPTSREGLTKRILCIWDQTLIDPPLVSVNVSWSTQRNLSAGCLCLCLRLCLHKDFQVCPFRQHPFWVLNGVRLAQLAGSQSFVDPPPFLINVSWPTQHNLLLWVSVCVVWCRVQVQQACWLCVCTEQLIQDFQKSCKGNTESNWLTQKAGTQHLNWMCDELAWALNSRVIARVVQFWFNRPVDSVSVQAQIQDFLFLSHRLWA